MSGSEKCGHNQVRVRRAAPRVLRNDVWMSFLRLRSYRSFKSDEQGAKPFLLYVFLADYRERLRRVAGLHGESLSAERKGALTSSLSSSVRSFADGDLKADN